VADADAAYQAAISKEVGYDGWMDGNVACIVLHDGRAADNTIIARVIESVGADRGGCFTYKNLDGHWDELVIRDDRLKGVRPGT
jgi:hypothetical protein